MKKSFFTLERANILFATRKVIKQSYDLLTQCLLAQSDLKMLFPEPLSIDISTAAKTFNKKVSISVTTGISGFDKVVCQRFSPLKRVESTIQSILKLRLPRWYIPGRKSIVETTCELSNDINSLWNQIYGSNLIHSSGESPVIQTAKHLEASLRYSTVSLSLLVDVYRLNEGIWLFLGLSALFETCNKASLAMASSVVSNAFWYARSFYAFGAIAAIVKTLISDLPTLYQAMDISTLMQPAKLATNVTTRSLEEFSSYANARMVLEEDHASELPGAVKNLMTFASNRLWPQLSRPLLQLAYLALFPWVFNQFFAPSHESFQSLWRLILETMNEENTDSFFSKPFYALVRFILDAMPKENAVSLSTKSFCALSCFILDTLVLETTSQFSGRFARFASRAIQAMWEPLLDNHFAKSFLSWATDSYHAFPANVMKFITLTPAGNQKAWVLKQISECLPCNSKESIASAVDAFTSTFLFVSPLLALQLASKWALWTIEGWDIFKAVFLALLLPAGATYLNLKLPYCYDLFASSKPRSNTLFGDNSTPNECKEHLKSQVGISVHYSAGGWSVLGVFPQTLGKLDAFVDKLRQHSKNVNCQALADLLVALKPSIEAQIKQQQAQAQQAVARAAQEAAEKQAAERAAQEAAAKQAAEKQAAERAAQEAAAKEAAEKQAAKRAAQEAAKQQAADKAAQEAAEKQAARRLADDQLMAKDKAGQMASSSIAAALAAVVKKINQQRISQAHVQAGAGAGSASSPRPSLPETASQPSDDALKGRFVSWFRENLPPVGVFCRSHRQKVSPKTMQEIFKHALGQSGNGSGARTRGHLSQKFPFLQFEGQTTQGLLSQMLEAMNKPDFSFPK